MTLEHPEAPAPPPPTPPADPHRYRWLVVVGWMLAVVAAVIAFFAFVYGIVFAAIPVAIGILLATSGRERAGIWIGVGTALLIAGLVLVVTVGLGGHQYRMPSGSMEPTLKIGDRFLTEEDDTPERGDVYAFHPPLAAESFDAQCGVPRPSNAGCPRPRGGEASVTFVKRVVALPGDRVKIVANRAYVNGRALDEPYIKTNPCADVCNLRREIVVPPGAYFMLGDNRGESDDSRSWGPIPKRWLVGRVVLRYWPLSRFGAL